MTDGGWGRQTSGRPDEWRRQTSARRQDDWRRQASSGRGEDWMKPAGQRGMHESAGVADEDYRRNLIMALFEVLDDSGNHLLGFSEMKLYAQLTGFNGSDDDWATEYFDLCDENGWNRNVGAHAGQFSMLIDDPDNRCYASNEVLIQMLQALSDITGKAIPIPQPGSHAGGGGGGGLNRLVSEGVASVAGSEYDGGPSYAVNGGMNPMRPMSENQSDWAANTPSFTAAGNHDAVYHLPIIKGSSSEDQRFLQKMASKDAEFQKRRNSMGSSLGG